MDRHEFGMQDVVFWTGCRQYIRYVEGLPKPTTPEIGFCTMPSRLEKWSESNFIFMTFTVVLLPMPLGQEFQSRLSLAVQGAAVMEQDVSPCAFPSGQVFPADDAHGDLRYVFARNKSIMDVG